MSVALPRRLIVSLALFVLAVPARAEPPRVLASINPLYSLAANVMDGVGQPTLLLRANASPHSYSLRPSDARAIEQAQVIFWIGPDYESFMARAVGSLPRKARAVQMSKLTDIQLLPVREGGVWESEADHGHGHDHGKGQAGSEQDMHLWLDPDNAKAVAQAMAATLAEADPANADRYNANVARLATRLDTLDGEMRNSLAPVAHRPYVVFHDAYHYLEHRYGLTPAGSITVTPDRMPGPRRLSDLRRAVIERNAACIFSEPQFTSSLVTTVASGTKARSGTLDPLRTATADAKEGYFAMMRGLAASLVTCLGESG
jgi:zinc transport system substrate-binding protein